MLHTNLATRPLYNERLVHAGLVIVGAIVLAVTVLNAMAIVTRSARASELERSAREAEARAAELERQAGQIQRESGGTELEGLAVAAQEANAIIDQRLFSWTQFFNLIEANLPPGVMLTAIRPTIDEAGIQINLSVMGRRVEDLDEFMERLERTGAFSDVLSRQEEVTEDGLYRAVLEARYLPGDAT